MQPIKRRSLGTSRIAQALARRRGETSAPIERVTVNSGGVVELPEDYEPLTEILQRARMATRPARSTTYIHVSDLIGKCIRRIALMENMQMQPPPQSIGLSQEITFRMGEAIHDVVKERTAAGAPQMIWGRWRCACKKTITENPSLLTEVGEVSCVTCGGPVNIYEEVPMVDKEFRIVGTPDLLTYLPQHFALYISELKSMSEKEWEDIVRPKPDHVIQVLFYWYLMNKLGYRLANRVSVLYITKGWLFSKVPYKEFTFDAEAQIHRLEDYLADARALKASRTGGKLPVRICVSEESPDAKKCEVCRTCFGGSDAKPVRLSVASAMQRRG